MDPIDTIGEMVLAAGALGTAAFGIVEALKWTRLGEAGFGAIVRVLGPVLKSLKIAYGPDFERLLRAQYRGDGGELARVIRQGARVGLTEAIAGEAGEFLGVVDVGRLKEAAKKVQAGEDLPTELRNVLGRFELALDSRIDAALALGQSHYAGAMRVAASIAALVIALSVAAYLSNNQPDRSSYLVRAVLIGIAAVPLAPVAKDLVTALQSASKAIRAKL